MRVEWRNSEKESERESSHSASTSQSRESISIFINKEKNIPAPYPVNYEKDNWNLLSVYLQSENRAKIPELTRAKLLHDAWNLAYAGELSFATAFNMTLFMRQERHHLVWDPVFTMIDHIGRHICSCIQDKFRVSFDFFWNKEPNIFYFKSIIHYTVGYIYFVLL